jgi:hypothetical protein
MIYAFNKQIACEPIANRTVASEIKSGFAVVKNKVELVKLKVVFGCDDIQANSYVYIKGDAVNLEWAKNVYAVEGVSVIMIPLQFVQMVENA